MQQVVSAAPLLLSTPLEQAFSDLLGRKPLRKLAAFTQCHTIRELRLLHTTALSSALDRLGLSVHEPEMTDRIEAAVPEPPDHSSDSEKEDPDVADLRTANSQVFVDGSLPEEVLLRIFEELPWKSLCVLPAACKLGTALPVGLPQLWREFWSHRGWEVPEEGDLKFEFLGRVRRACVECFAPTDYVFPLLGCRLCPACERAHSKYSLVSHAVVRGEYHLRQADLAGCPSIAGPRAYGRLYLRSHVDTVRHDVAVETRRKVLRFSKVIKGKSHGQQKHAASNKAAQDVCCFDVSGLRLQE
eukprot:TRINITY_DN21703_c0_g1_i1.p1 TRINITY_DN21703_c0_g1~~TRINITY_DN21703_c0_g1_i1.p1  ORF type:complete len:300 (+),score=41.36 TRINITY_DN21703_c0_g1_i1:90-989(+)